RNAPRAALPHSLGSVAASGRSVAAVANTAPSPRGTDGARGIPATGGQHRWQRQRPLASRPIQGPLHWALQCPLPIARTPLAGRGALAQPLEPPCTDPYARWCGRGGAARLPPIPI